MQLYQAWLKQAAGQTGAVLPRTRCWAGAGPVCMQIDGAMGAWLAVTPREDHDLRSCKAAPSEMA